METSIRAPPKAPVKKPVPWAVLHSAALPASVLRPPHSCGKMAV